MTLGHYGLQVPFFGLHSTKSRSHIGVRNSSSSGYGSSYAAKENDGADYAVDLADLPSKYEAYDVPDPELLLLLLFHEFDLYQRLEEG